MASRKKRKKRSGLSGSSLTAMRKRAAHARAAKRGGHKRKHSRKGSSLAAARARAAYARSFIHGHKKKGKRGRPKGSKNRPLSGFAGIAALEKKRAAAAYARAMRSRSRMQKGHYTGPWAV